MKIVVIGTRGIPDIPGGVETHCQELFPRIAAKGNDVTVIRRSCYVEADKDRKEFEGVKLVDVYAPRKKSLEAIVHTFLAVIKAKRLKADVVHIHAIGPALMTPFARLLGMKVVMTNHGPDYDRGKWGKLAKTFLKTGERLGTKAANRVIVISTVIADILKNRYGRTDTDLIYNGVNAPVKSKNTDYINSLGLEPGKYIVGVGRFVEEKGFHDLVEAYKKLTDKSFKLVIAGDSDHPDHYSESLKKQAREAGVVLTGYIRGEKMNQVMTNAALFAMPSYHEGLPIALLEAMSYDLDVLVSDIPANKISELSADDFFPVGNVDELAAGLQRKLAEKATPRHHDLAKYDWDHIAEQINQLYHELTK
ncbi:MAG: glycosyltransferase family 4 protein [Muribaculaceae bacterium]|nr:glycosyltransferase family 4 protein [Muribaculaceae bacterium]